MPESQVGSRTSTMSKLGRLFSTTSSPAGGAGGISSRSNSNKKTNKGNEGGSTGKTTREAGNGSSMTQTKTRNGGSYTSDVDRDDAGADDSSRRSSRRQVSPNNRDPTKNRSDGETQTQSDLSSVKSRTSVGKNTPNGHPTSGASPDTPSIPSSTTSASSVPTEQSISRNASLRGGRSSSHHYGSGLGGRFRILPDGSHEHHLRRLKRQEKLGQMMKDWLSVGGGNRRSDAVSAVPKIFSSNNLMEMDSQIKAVLNDSENSTKQSAASSASLTATEVSTSSSALVSTTTAPAKSGDRLPPSLFSTYVKEQQILPNQKTSVKQPLFQFTDKEHKESFFEKYGKCQETVGRGAFGIVRVAHKKVNNKEILFAVKEFTKRTNEPDTKYSKRLTYEFCISSSLKHNNIIDAYDLFKDSKGEYCEVMEYCTGGDLYSLIVAAGKLEYVEADCFFKQIMRAVHYMHNMGVSHRDLKPENILLTQDGRIKISDFGSAECFKTAWDDEIELSNGIKGSSPYIAPEEFTSREFDPRFVDVWSCGVIYMAMRTGRQLWREAKVDDEFFYEYLKKRKCEKGYEPIEMLKRARCRNVIYSILDPVPERRITTLQILNSEWVREINCCKN